MALTNDFKVKNGLTVTDSISAGGNLSASDGFFDGNVGIGTTSPSQLLTLEGSSAAIKVSESGGAELRMAAGGSLGYIGTYNSNDLAILAGAGEKIRVKTDGNVGIGTTTPSEKLQVKGNLALSGASASAGPHLKLQGTYTTWELENQYTGGATNDMFRIRNTQLGADALTINRLTNNVGIGTTSPTEKLHISSTTTATLAIQSGSNNAEGSKMRLTEGGTYNGGFIHYDGSANALKLGVHAPFNSTLSDDTTVITIPRDTGNVGIGTTSPGHKLTVGGSLSAHRITESDSFCNVKIGTNTLKNNTTGDNNVAIGSNTLCVNTEGDCNTAIGKEALRFNTTGVSNAAIGPFALYCNTEGGYNAALGDRALLNNTTGNNNVGVGYLALGDNTCGSCNVAVGYQSLKSNTEGECNIAMGKEAALCNTTGGCNVAFGPYALRCNTTGTHNFAAGSNSMENSLSGIQNIAIGQSALFSNWGGNCNTSIGYLSLQCNTTGTANAAVGAQSLRCNTTGSNNVALGPISLFKNTTGGDNIALGCNALYGNTTGGCNFAAGTNSLANNLSACYNTAIGQYALLANYGGCSNTAIGQGTLKSNTTGGCNNAFGKYALCSNTTGCHNTAIGCESLKSNTCGFHNFAAGEYSLHDNTTGHYNAAIGKNALCANTCGDHNTAIGESALKANTEGCWNIAVGQNSLKDNVDGKSNVAQGYYTLCNNCTGNYNIALGHQALFEVEATHHNVGIGFYAGLNTTGGCNIAIGAQALQSNTTASNNVAIGPYALMCNTTSTGNTAVGQAASCLVTGACNTSVGAVALTNTCTGIQNTAVGHSAARSNTTGSGNTTLGVLSLFSNTDGANNTATGFTAGRFASNGSTEVTSPDQSTYIGACARAGSATPTNETVIGYLACGCGSNTTMIGNSSTTAAYICGDVNTSSKFISGGQDLFNLFCTSAGTGTVTNVAGCDGITVNNGTGSACVCVNSSVVRTTGNQTIGGTKNFCSCICVADQLRHTGDFDTRISFGTDTMQIEAGDCSQICLTTGGTVINEEGKSIDFRVEGDTDPHALFVDGSADKVGIGCSSPTAKLDINQTATTRALQVFRNEDQANTEALAYFTDEHASSTQPTVRIRNDGSGDSLQVRKESTAHLTVKSDGDIGIGTDSPAAKLDVVGGHIRLDAGQSLQWDNTHERIEQSDGHLEFFVNNGEAMTLDTNGLGIAITSPTQKLHVDGNVLISSGKYYYGTGTNGGYGTDNSGNIKIKQNGSDLIFGSGNNVGIGCTTPTEKLAVAGDGLFTSNLTVQGSLSVLGDFTCLETTVSLTSAMDITNHGTGPALLVNQTGSNDIVNFQDDGTSAFYIEDGGNVGIGCTNPTQKLDVAGTVKATSLDINGAANIDGLLDVNSGSANTVAIFESTDDKAFIKIKDDDTDTHLISKDGTFSIGESSTDYDNFKVNISSGNTNIAGDLAVCGGDITLGGTGRIQGIDTVSSGTDAANKTYADTKLACAGGTMTGNVRFNDTIKAEFGSSADLQINHDGTDTLINNGTGNLTLRQSANDKDIIFQNDDGSGGVTPYFCLDGSVADGSNVITRFPDQSILGFGSGSGFQDGLQIYHNATSSFINNYVGNLEISNNTNDGDIIFKSDDGSGGITNYLQIDGGGVLTRAYKNFRVQDDVNLQAGSSGDLEIVHASNHSYINNNTGDLYITNSTDDGDVIFRSDDTTGGVTEYFRLDGGDARMYATREIRFCDGVASKYGNAGDLGIYHDGSNSYIADTSGTGSLIVNTNAFLLKSANDGEYMMTAYEDGAVNLFHNNNPRFSTTSTGACVTGNLSVVGNVLLNDTRCAIFGSGQDLKINHDGSNSYMENNTGDLIIRQLADDKAICFQNDNGAGGYETYFELQGVSGGTSPFTVFPDSSTLVFGDGHDLRIYHDGSHSYVVNNTGDLEIINNTDDGDIKLVSDDGSGGTATYLRIDGGSTNIQAYKDLLIANDTAKIKLGASQDLQIYHDGSNSYIDDAGTGVLNVRADDHVYISAATGGTNMASFTRGGAVKLKYNDSQKFATTTDGIQLYGNGYLDMPDNGRLRMGASYDLAMYHDGTHSYLTNNVTGSLYIQSGNSVQIESSAGENMIVASANGAVQLYYDNSSKLQTTCSGISVCGDALISGHVCATTKSFVIDNPTTDGKLRYSVVEGNEHGVTVRGSTCSGTIELPDEWDWLVDEDSVTAQLTPVGGPHQPYVVSQDNKQVVVCSDGCYNYNIYGTRKDVEPLEVNML